MEAGVRVGSREESAIPGVVEVGTTLCAHHTSNACTVVFPIVSPGPDRHPHSLTEVVEPRRIWIGG
jgi:hypothetical protein